MIPWLLLAVGLLSAPKPPRLASFVIHGSPVLSLADSLRPWQLLVRDSAATPRVVQRLLERIAQTYRNRGFPAPQIRVAYFTGPATGMTLHVALQPGPLAKPANLQVQGVARPPGILVHWFAPVRAQPYAEHRLREITQAWNRRFGDRLRVDSFELRLPDTLVLYVRPLVANRLAGALTYGADGRILGRFALDFRNLAGTLRALSLRWWRWRAEEQELRVAYEEPWVLFTRLRAEGRMYLQDTLLQVWEGALLVFPLAIPYPIGFGISHQRSLWIPTQQRSRETRSLVYLEIGSPQGGGYGLLRAEATQQFLRYQGRVMASVPVEWGVRTGTEIVAAGISRSPTLLPSDLLEVPLQWLPLGVLRVPREMQRLLGLRLFVGFASPSLNLRILLEQNRWTPRDAEEEHGRGAGLELRWRTPGGLEAGLQYSWPFGTPPWQGILRLTLSQAL